MLSLVFAGSHGKTVRDGLVCPQIRIDPHRLEALAKPWKFGRGSVPAALDSPSHWEGQRPRCPIRRHTGNEDVVPPVWLNPARKLLAGCIAFCDSDSCAKHLADGVAKSFAKLSKQISRNHRPTCLTRPIRPTSPSAKREAPCRA